MVKRLAAVVLALALCWASGAARAEDPFLKALGPAGDPARLVGFSQLSLKAVGRVDLKITADLDVSEGSQRYQVSAEATGFSVFGRVGDWIQREDHVTKISLVVNHNPGNSVTLTWSDARVAVGTYDTRARPHALAFKLGSVSDPERIDAVGPSFSSRDEVIHETGQILTSVWQMLGLLQLPLPDRPIAAGQPLLATDAEAARRQVLETNVLPYYRGLHDGDPSPAETQSMLAKINVSEWENGARVRGMTRIDDKDYVDYGGPFKSVMDDGSGRISREGEIRCLIDPFSGIVRSAAFVARGGDGKRYIAVSARMDTFIDRRVTAPAPSAAAPSAPASMAPPPSDATIAMPAPPPAPASARPMNTADLYDRAIGSVVTVVAGDALGSGFYVADGIVVTNAHVVGDVRQVELAGKDGAPRQGKVLKVDKAADIAFIKTAGGVRPLPLAIDLPRTGEQALVIGSPGGLEGTLTGGLVSSVRVVDGVKYVQTDASINHGNSGGPVLDLAGRVIGMATMKLSDAEQGFEGLGFAISAIEIRKRMGS